MNEQAQKIVESIPVNAELLHSIYILIAVIFVLVFLKSIIEEFIFGIFWKFRSDFNNRDIVRINRIEWARIIHIGALRTEFTIFEFGEGDNAPKGGYTRFISNARLKEFEIDKPLQLAALPRALKGMMVQGGGMMGETTQ